MEGILPASVMDQDWTCYACGQEADEGGEIGCCGLFTVSHFHDDEDREYGSHNGQAFDPDTHKCGPMQVSSDA